jgi:hypothetical protein
MVGMAMILQFGVSVGFILPVSAAERIAYGTDPTDRTTSCASAS